jgi:hypothetical protein
MSSVREDGVHPRGEALFQELLWVHGIIRSNLTTITQVIEDINRDAPTEQIRGQINDLAANSVIWRLRVNCLQYCHLVHGHHHHEDVSFFPALRRANPNLDEVIDKLEADHRVVSDLLDDVEAAARRLSEASARPELADALRWLSEHLLVHLDYEEAKLAPTLRRLRSWPPRADERVRIAG